MASRTESTSEARKVGPWDDVVKAEVVDDRSLQERLDGWVFSRRDGGESNNDELRAIDDLEQATRLDDPDARFRFIEALSISSASTLLARLAVNVDEHERRASLLQGFRNELAAHLHMTAEGESQPAPGPQPERGYGNPRKVG